MRHVLHGLAMGSLAVTAAGQYSGRAVPPRQGTDIALVAHGKTIYRIVKPAKSSPVDDYAAQELAGYLKQIAGAEFPVVGPDNVVGGAPSIFIGLSAPALKRLGPDPLAELEDQEHVARSVGSDICLYGKGVHGYLYAVIEFLENSLGWRWFSLFEQPMLPSTPTVALRPFERRSKCSFRTCSMEMQRSLDWAYQMGVNL